MSKSDFTFVVQMTSPGVSAIAVLLVAGPDAEAIVGKLVAPRGLPESGRMIRVRLHWPGDVERLLDDALIVRPEKDRFELHVHGGMAVVEGVIAALAGKGVRALTLGEAQARGLFGEVSSLRAELALAFPGAQTITAFGLLAAQVTVGMMEWARRWTAYLSDARTSNDLWPVQSAAQGLLLRSRVLVRLLEPARVAIIGPPNAGKSTLANALLGRPVSITSDIAGTTRDWVDAQAVLVAAGTGGQVEVAVTLIDTAGIRETEDVLELESIRRTHGQAAGADVIVLLLDASRPPSDEELSLFRRDNDVPVVVAINKIDLILGGDFLGRYPRAVPISAKNHEGFDGLMTAVLRALDLHAVSDGEPFAFTERQRDVLLRVAGSSEPGECLALLAQLSS